VRSSFAKATEDILRSDWKARPSAYLEHKIPGWPAIRSSGSRRVRSSFAKATEDILRSDWKARPSEGWWEALVTLQFVASDFVLRHPIYSRAAGSLPGRET
jgi:hypothetical protein